MPATLTEPLTDKVGRVGTDADGVRFIVLDVGNLDGSDGWADGWHVVILPGSRRDLIPGYHVGAICHASWLAVPIEWDDTE